MKNLLSFMKGLLFVGLLLQECERVGFNPNIICETSQWKFILEMVSCNMGISILPQSNKTELNVAHKGIKVLPIINQEVHWQIGIVWRKDGYLSYATKEWIEFLKERLINK